MNTVVIDYTNHRGERAERVIQPTGEMVFETSAFHYRDGQQWFIRAHALDRDGNPLRFFAMKDIHSWKPGTDQIES